MSNNILSKKRTIIVEKHGSEVDASQLKQADFEVQVLAETPYLSTFLEQKKEFVGTNMVSDEVRRIMYDPKPGPKYYNDQYPVSRVPFTMRLASPRKSLHFEPGNTTVGIVTCGGLCPGLNDVIRSITLTCINDYNVKCVKGFRYGYWGLSAAGRDTAVELTSDNVKNIHRRGGTMLGTSRGPQPLEEMLETLVYHGVSIIFTIGGDGTQKGAAALGNEIMRRGLNISVMGIPKTIDNDLSFTHRTFGFETAVAEAVTAIRAAAAEASSHDFGVGVVKVMGRHSGFIAAQACVASAQTHLCFIPEMPVTKDLLWKLLEKRFEVSNYCVICVAEGFGQDWGDVSAGFDASGNKKLIDIGALMSKEIAAWMKKNPKYKNSTVKYIDPSYMIRARAPSSSDAAFCVHLSSLAVHEAFAGVTNALITAWYENYITIPIRLAVSLRKQVSVVGPLWRQVREVTVDLDEDAVEKKRSRLRRQLSFLDSRQSEIKLALSRL